MKTNQSDLLEASLTNASVSSSSSSEQNDQALPSLSSSQSFDGELSCPPTLADTISGLSPVLKRSSTEPAEALEFAAKRAKLDTGKRQKEPMEKSGDMVPSNSFVEIVDLHPNSTPAPTATQLEYDPTTRIKSFTKSPSVKFAQQLG